VDFYYFDASVLVKAYLWEAGTEAVRQVLRDVRAASPSARIITSSIAYAEAMSAVSRRERAGKLTAKEATEIENRLRADFIGPVLPYVILEPRQPMVHHAADLARQHRLRALDAIHLASALAVRFNTPHGVGFLFGSADQRLNLAASNESLAIFNPQAPIPAGLVSSVAPPV
jgi:predicted nucleic acid-binding protein